MRKKLIALMMVTVMAITALVGSGIKAVQEGRCDIGLSSRDLKDEEKASGLKATVLAYDGIAIIVNPENLVSDLDVETIAKRNFELV